MSDTQKPLLWKQLIGALSGAGIALVLYGTYSMASPSLQALVTLYTSQAPSTNADNGTIVGTQPLVPTGTLSFPAPTVPAEVPLVSGLTASSSSQAPLPSIATAWIRRFRQWSSSSSPAAAAVEQPIVANVAASSSSSPAAVQPNIYTGNGPLWPTSTLSFPADPVVNDSVRAPDPFPPRMNPLAAAQFSSAPVSDPVVAAQEPEQVAQEPVAEAKPEPALEEEPVQEPEQEPLEDTEEEVAITEPVSEEQPMEEQPFVAAVSGHSEQLPNSGFGLDLLVVAAAGAVVGRRRAAKRA